MIADPTAFSKVDSTNEPYPNATTNACKLCTPLGACLAFKGIAGAVPFLHGSQGCATYIRRYLISHFREPMDIAASNFSESSAVFGGAANLKLGLSNVLQQYKPEFIGLATTCLSETIGEDVPGHLHEFHAAQPTGVPIVPVSTASFRGTHADGFHDALRAVVSHFVKEPPKGDLRRVRGETITLLPGMVSAADLREIKRITGLFGLSYTLLPDYSDTLDGQTWATYEKLPPGGTPLSSLETLSDSAATLEFGRVLAGAKDSAGQVLQRRASVPLHALGLPLGLRETDAWIECLSNVSGKEIPPSLRAERGRLVDSWVDGHKYVFEKRAVVYGEEDLVVGLAALLTEIGIVPVVCASGGRSGRLASALKAAAPELDERTVIKEGVDFSEILALCETAKPDFLLGNSKGYSLARKLQVPLVRCGFPVHDRIGAQRLLHVGYAGAQALFDTIVNTLLERKQADSSIGYSYL